MVLEYVPTTYGTQDNGKPETDCHLIGSGQAVVFADGGATTASWSKAADGAPTYLLDSAGKPRLAKSRQHLVRDRANRRSR